jgi:NAD(P)-dependent dehydrogenase (short-subunit alcohol dehydrogenase family)
VYPVDIHAHAEVDAAVQSAIAELGEIDVLINNVSLTPLHL